jgi:hypothetical protein
LTLALLVLVSPVNAMDDPAARATLRGLKGVRVVVDADQDAATFQADAELELGKVGIPALSKDEWSASPGLPMLHLFVSSPLASLLGDSGKADLHRFVRVELVQLASLVRDGSLVAPAVTWSVGSTAHGDLQYIRDSVRNEVGGFIEAWFIANPKTTMREHGIGVDDKARAA